ncbi:MAG: hypothetical protein LBF22_09925, partial [Deltaproteobacteria bacterium]|jgi:tetratricopeptide (TPR) repeat protein|nr:hypothetical protein [Deltaproteobacteria bacterium]
MLQEATDIYNSMAILPQSDEIRLLRAMAAVNLVLSLSISGDQERARAVFEKMADIGKSEELNTIRAAAAVYLLEAYERLGNYEDAKVIFKDLNTLGVGDSEDVSISAAGAAVVMARIAVKASDIDGAKAMYKLVDSLEQKFNYLWEKKDEIFSILYEATGETEF